MEAVGGEDVSEGEAVPLEELAAEGIDLMEEASVCERRPVACARDDAAYNDGALRRLRTLV